MNTKRKKSKFLRLSGVVICLLLTMCTIMSIDFTAFAETAANSEVTDVANSMIQVRMAYNDDGVTTPIMSGSGFLINNNTVLTCAHVVDPDSSYNEEVRKLLTKLYGKNYSKDNITIQVVVSGDVTITATIKKESLDTDFAILNLTEAIYDRKPVTLGDSDDVSATQMVYALGFPEAVANLQSKNTYTTDDVTITDGKVSKIMKSNKFTTELVDYIQHGATITAGNSGGPLVDEDGIILGIVNAKWTDNTYNYAISINQVKSILYALGIEYNSYPTTDGDPTEDTQATEEIPAAVVTEAPTTVEPDTEEPTEDSAPVSEPMDLTKIIIIVSIIVLVIILAIVIILIVASSKKKSFKKAPLPAQTGTPFPGAQQSMNNSPHMPQTPQVSRQMSNRPPFAPSNGSAPTIPQNDGAGETSVLNEGAGETTVLGLQQSNATLVRKSNGDKVLINKPEFIIGKERRKVDYCISDNNSISRTHAKIRVRAGKYYIADLGSTNFTYVNGSKLSPNQEVALSKGDKIKISDEEFEFLG